MIYNIGQLLARYLHAGPNPIGLNFIVNFDICGFRVLNGLEELQSMKLLMGLFNRGFSRLLFIVKLDCLCLVILNGFSAIRVSHSNPLWTSLVYLVFMNAGVVYTAMFQLAFKVTEGVEKLRRVIKVKSIEIRIPLKRRWIHMRLRSTSVLAVNVGGFHDAERESVPIFLDFVVKQILNLL